MDKLEMFFKENPKALVALSGGTDSSYLLNAAKKYGADVRPYFVKTQFQPVFELLDARRAADAAGVTLNVLYENVLDNELICANDSERCYYCKQFIFEKLVEAARNEGTDIIIDGTNASDDEGDRPGMKALLELEIRSPLRECGITKAEVRQRSKELGLYSWRKPSYSCLATRFPTGTPITAEGLEKIEQAEDFLFALGFTDFRIRLYHGGARIQLPESQIFQLINKRREILAEFKGFDVVTLDLATREESEP